MLEHTCNRIKALLQAENSILNAEQAFTVEYQPANVELELPDRLSIRPSSEAPAALIPYLSLQCVSMIDALKRRGTKDGLYTPSNDGMYYLAANADTVSQIVANYSKGRQLVTGLMGASRA